MAVYKDEKTNTWKVYYRFTDWQGKVHQSTKRGFPTKREALAWEREQQNKVEADLNMTFESFVDTYTADMKNRLKENTWHTKEHIIRTKLLPYFAKRKINTMERHGIEWEHKGTHEKHLSVLDYKKQEREKEIAVLDNQLAEKKDEFQTMQSRIQNYDNGTQVIEELEKRIETDSEFQLPDPPALMSAKSYKQKFVDPLIKRLKDVIKEVFYRYYHALDSYHRLNNTNANLYRENERLSNINDRLTDENTTLRAENKDFKLIRKVFGSQQIDALIAQAKEQEQQRKHTKQPSNQRTKRIRNNDFER